MRWWAASWLVLVVAVIVWAVVSAGGGSGERQAQATATAAAAGGGGAAGSGQVAVKIQDFLYVPTPLTVTPGTKVTWTQLDAVPHTVTSGAPGGTNNGSVFDQQLLNVNDTFSFTFNQTGSFAYFCRFHLQMIATVNVQEPGALVRAQTSPTATPTPQPATTVTPGQVVPPPTNATLVAAGLLNPRGFTWGPDGALYVAEAGTPDNAHVPGTDSIPNRLNLLFCNGWTVTHTQTKPPPQCPQDEQLYMRTGRVSKVTPDGTRTTVVDGLPVIIGMFGFTEGPASVAFIGDDLYLLLLGEDTANAKVSNGLPSGIYRINKDGTGTLIADLHGFNVQNPPVFIPPDWGAGELYDMVSLNGKLYATDGNAGVVFEVDPAAPQGSRIRRLADLSTNHPVPTGISVGPDGNLYVTMLDHAPYPKGSAKVWRISTSGQVTELGAGLTLGVGIAVAPGGAIYASEFANILDQPPFIGPPGRIVHYTPGGQVQMVADNLMFPTVIRWGPEGLYVTYFSLGAEIGAAPGAIYRLKVAPPQ